MIQSDTHDLHLSHLPRLHGTRQRADHYSLAEPAAVSDGGMGADALAEADDQIQSSPVAFGAIDPACDPHADHRVDRAGGGAAGSVSHWLGRLARGQEPHEPDHCD